MQNMLRRYTNENIAIWESQTFHRKDKQFLTSEMKEFNNWRESQ